MSEIFKVAQGVSLCLASGSPRRKLLLGSLNIPFEILIPSCVESPPEKGEMPGCYAARMASVKANAACALLRNSGKTVIAADTIVCIAGQILGKPKSADMALQMLHTLNGNRHAVHTGVAIALPASQVETFIVTSQVKFGNWPLAALEAYVKTGEPMDKAGAYAAQGQGAFLVESIEGSWSNVVGLPLSQLVSVLLEKGVLTRCA